MGNRAGQGFNVPKPKRAHCPECGKKGVTAWKVTPFGLSRHCQFCGQAWGEAGWNAAKAPKKPAEKVQTWWTVEATYRKLEDAQEAWDALMNIGDGPIRAKQPINAYGMTPDAYGVKGPDHG